jgi:hypothetical protein
MYPKANQNASVSRHAAAAAARPRPGWLVMLWLLVVMLPARAEPVSKEYQLKAAFIYNFTKFVEWPARSPATNANPIIIGVLGASPFGDELEKIVRGRSVNGRPLEVKHLDSVEQASGVDLLFVPRSQESRLAGRVPALNAAGVLTVGESPAFAAADGIITFTTEADKIRFEINNGEAESGGLRISSNLLKLAAEVKQRRAGQ